VQVILDRRNKDSLITWVKEVRRYLVHNSQGEHIITILPFLMKIKSKHQSASSTVKWTQLSPYLKFNWVESREIVEKLHWLNTHFIALQISDNDLFVQICAHAQLRFTSTTEFRCNFSFRGGYEKWINNMGEIRCHLYPVHNSQGKSKNIILPIINGESSWYRLLTNFIDWSHISPVALKFRWDCSSRVGHEKCYLYLLHNSRGKSKTII
jgi:hypothetical protein